MRAHKFTAPSAWASYLINHDDSGLEPEEIAACDAWVKSVGMGLPCDAVDCGFMWDHSAYSFSPYGGDCARYTFLGRSHG